MTAVVPPVPTRPGVATEAGLTSARRAFYGVGSIGTGVFTTVPSVLLLYFLTTEVHIQAAVAGLIVLIPKLLGVAGDPLVGLCSDRLSRRSRTPRAALMLLGAVMTGAGLWALFSLPQHRTGNVLLPGLVYAVCTAGYSMFAVPYSALPPELEARPDARGRLVSLRLGISFVGAVIGGVTAPLLAVRIGYPSMALSLGAVCVAAMSVSLLAHPKVLSNQPARVSAQITPPARLTFDPAFGRRVIAFVLLLSSAGAFAALLPFLARDMGVNAGVVIAAMFVNLVMAALTSGLWSRLIRIGSLSAVWVCAAGAMAAGSIIIAFRSHPDLLFYLGAALGGVGFSGVQVAGFTSLADAAAAHLDRGGAGGLLTGLWMAGEKAGLAGGPMLVGLGLQFVQGGLQGSTSRTLLVAIPATLVTLAILALLLRAPGDQLRPSSAA